MQIDNIACSLAQKNQNLFPLVLITNVIIFSFYPIVLNTEMNMICFLYEAIILFLHLMWYTYTDLCFQPPAALKGS